MIDEIEDVCHMKGLYPEGILLIFLFQMKGNRETFTENQFEDFMGAIGMLKTTRY